MMCGHANLLHYDHMITLLFTGAGDASTLSPVVVQLTAHILILVHCLEFTELRSIITITVTSKM